MLLQNINNIFSLSKLADILAVISVFFNIWYFLVKPESKKISYKVMNNRGMFAIALWNACKSSILREDIYYCCFRGIPSSKVLYILNTDTPLEIDHDPKEESVFKFSFDFLYRRQGYFILFYGDEKNNGDISKIKLSGRLRGRSRYSFYKYKEYAALKPVIASIIAAIPWVIVGLQERFQKPRTLVALSIVILCFCISIYALVLERVPSKINAKIKQYKKSGYS